MKFPDSKSVKLTPFEWNVLRVTARIPLGQTRSYQWVARAVGRPSAVRAVGQVLKKNPYPLIIPCHRVVRSDGSMGGYSGGGVAVKARLLRLEQEIAKNISIRR